MSDSKSGSKSDLSEPLLDEGAEKAGETPEKEMIEMEEKKDDAEGEKKEEKKEKKKKEKKEKAPKVKKEPGPSCIDTMSSGLDMNVRDANGLNCEIDVSCIFFQMFFDNVLIPKIFFSWTLTMFCKPIMLSWQLGLDHLYQLNLILH